MSAIIPSPVIKIAFKILPMPNNLKTAKIVIQNDITKPRLELARIREVKKKRKANKFMKNKNINDEEDGSVK